MTIRQAKFAACYALIAIIASLGVIAMLISFVGLLIMSQVILAGSYQ